MAEMVALRRRAILASLAASPEIPGLLGNDVTAELRVAGGLEPLNRAKYYRIFDWKSTNEPILAMR